MQAWLFVVKARQGVERRIVVTQAVTRRRYCCTPTQREIAAWEDKPMRGRSTEPATAFRVAEKQEAGSTLAAAA